MGAKLEYRIYRSVDDLEAIRKLWGELLESYSLSTTFSTLEWLIPWWQNLGQGQGLFVIGVFDTGQLVGLAPLSIVRRRIGRMLGFRVLRLMGDGTQDSDNLDFPVRAGYEYKFPACLLDVLESERSHWDLASFNTMPKSSPAASSLRNLMRQKQWVVQENETPASQVQLPDTWEEYLQQLSGEDRKNLERYARRLEKRYAVKTYRCCEEDQLEKCLDAMFAHHQARWEAAGQRGSFRSNERRRFYYELSRELLPQRCLDLWVLELDSEIAAVQFGFRYGKKVFQLQEGNNPKHSSDRVGFLLRGYVLKELIAEGIRTYDFLGGAPGYKAKWGAQAGHYLSLRFARPSTPGAAYLQAENYAGRGKSWLRRNLPSSAWKLLHSTNIVIKGMKSRAARTSIDGE